MLLQRRFIHTPSLGGQRAEPRVGARRLFCHRHRSVSALVELYDVRKGLTLTTEQKADLVEYLKSR